MGRGESLGKDKIRSPEALSGTNALRIQMMMWRHKPKCGQVLYTDNSVLLFFCLFVCYIEEFFVNESWFLVFSLISSPPQEIKVFDSWSLEKQLKENLFSQGGRGIGRLEETREI